MKHEIMWWMSRLTIMITSIFLSMTLAAQAYAAEIQMGYEGNLVFEPNELTVNAVTYNHDCTKILSCSDDGTIKQWDISTGTCILTIQADTKVKAAGYNHDSSRIVAGTKDGFTQWNAGTGKQISHKATRFTGLLRLYVFTNIFS